MDEVAGLVGAYAIAYRLVDVPATRGKIRAQVPSSATTSPTTATCSSGRRAGSPPVGRPARCPRTSTRIVNALTDITGTDFASRIDFMGALDKAGYLAMLRDPILSFQVGGFAVLVDRDPTGAGAGALGLVQGGRRRSSASRSPARSCSAARRSPTCSTRSPTRSGSRTCCARLALYVHRECFDVVGATGRGRARSRSRPSSRRSRPLSGSRLWTRGLRGGVGGNCRLSISLRSPCRPSTAPTRSSGTLLGLVAGWRARRPRTEFASVSESPFTSALALLHSAGATDAEREAEEAKLVDLLDAAYDELGTDLPVEPNDETGRARSAGADERRSIPPRTGTS